MAEHSNLSAISRSGKQTMGEAPADGQDPNGSLAERQRDRELPRRNADGTHDGQAGCDPLAAVARLDGNIELYKSLLQSFFDDASGTRQRLSRAVEQLDAAALHRAAHGLKGVAATCGAIAVARLAAQLDEMASAGRLENIGQVHAQLESAVARARQQLADYRCGQ